MTGLAVAVVLGGVAWLAAGWDGFPIVRLGVAVAVFRLYLDCRRNGGALALVSPLPLLAVQALVLYSLIPWALSGLHGYFMVSTHAVVATYLGSRAEALVLGFALLAAAVARAVPVGVLSPATSDGFLERRGVIVLGAVAVTAIVALVGFRLTGAPGGLAGQVHDGMAPMALVSVALLHAHWIGRPRFHARYCMVVLAVVAILMLLGVGKQVVYAVAAGALSWALASPLPPVVRLKTVSVLLVVGMVAVAAMAFSRDLGAPERFRASWQEPARGLVEKIVDRQLDTGWCFGNVLAEHLRPGEPTKAGYFVAGLVPRALWPDKPSLSVGYDLGIRYCGKDPIWKHSASITLLGEPVIRAGFVGMAAAAAACFAGLLGVGWLAGRMGPPGLGLWVGLAPWLVDFDQTFAMYVANGVKCLLYAAPVLALAHHFRRREDKPCAA